jgi:hypothetical protein
MSWVGAALGVAGGIMGAAGQRKYRTAVQNASKLRQQMRARKHQQIIDDYASRVSDLDRMFIEERGKGTSEFGAGNVALQSDSVQGWKGMVERYRREDLSVAERDKDAELYALQMEGKLDDLEVKYQKKAAQYGAWQSVLGGAGSAANSVINR